MPAFFFPNLDAIRVAVASGLVPVEIALAPAAAGFDNHGGVWLETDATPSRESLAALARFGVQILGVASVPTRSVHCWADVLLLRECVTTAGGRTLFELPDRRLAAFVARLRRLHQAPVGVRLLPEPTGRAWVTTSAPREVIAWLDDADADVRAYWQHTANVWTARGWAHPLAEYLGAPDHGVVLCDPARGILRYSVPVPDACVEEFPLPARSVRSLSGGNPPRVPPSGFPPGRVPRIELQLVLKRISEARGESFWVLTSRQLPGFREWCQAADDHLLRHFQIAWVSLGSESRLIIRPASGDDHSAYLPVQTAAFHPDPRLPWLYVPSGFAIRPVVRANELIRAIAPAAEQLVWVEVIDERLTFHAASESVFRPLCDVVQYIVPDRVALLPAEPREESFSFARFALQMETSIDLEVEVAEEPPTVVAAPAPREPGWVSRSVVRVLGWARREPAANARPSSTTSWPGTTSDPSRPRGQ